MNLLWAPWRMGYIKTALKGGMRCFFCAALKERKDGAGNLVLFRGEDCFAILNRFPYNNGHLMVAPKRHTASIGSLTPAERLEMWDLTARMQEALRRVSRPDGYNLGINQGRSAGAGLPGHLHLHVVPRWGGDTNFMTITGKTKVIPVSLAATYRSLRRALGVAACRSR